MSQADPKACEIANLRALPTRRAGLGRQLSCNNKLGGLALFGCGSLLTCRVEQANR